jgi:serine protease AprX
VKPTRLFKFLIIASLLFSVVGLPAQQTPTAKVQPVLVELAAQDPGQLMDVIVQKMAGSTGTEEQVAALGGRVTHDLHIINAFAAEMPAAAALKLARTGSVRWVSLDAAMESAACAQCVDTSKLANAYIGAIRADQAWNRSPYLQGQGIGVAVIDSGINPNGDLYTTMGVNRQVANVRFNTDYNQNASDGYGHGTVVSSLVGGDGSDSGGKYIGVAPMVNIVNVKVSNDDGSSTTASVVEGLQWVLDHNARYNIRVVNLSLNSTVAESYHTSALDAAVEILWFNKIVVVASAGNSGNGAIYPPANDPFIITVGATDDKGSRKLSDDVMATFSAYGTTSDGFTKPDLVAPGKNIVGRLVNTNMGMGQAHPANVISGNYFKMSGTSVSAPMVSGAVALLLQDEPSLNPDQVKYRLMSTANKNWDGYDAAKAGGGTLDVYAVVQGTTTETANTGILASELLTSGSTPITWDSVGWNSVGWNSVGWNSVGWNSVGWNSVGWNSDYWGP